MSDMGEAPIICRLCGNPIVEVKGKNKAAHKEEVAHMLHVSCSKKHEQILQKHSVRQEDYTNALFQGMTQLLHLEETEPVKSFYTRVEEATQETHKQFPYQAAKAQKAKEQSQNSTPLQTIEVKRAPKGVVEKPKGKGKKEDGN